LSMVSNRGHEMREKFAQWLRLYTLKEVEVDNEHENGIVPWAKATQDTRDYWLKGATEGIALISQEIEKNMMMSDDEMYEWFATTKGDTMDIFQIIRYMNLKQGLKILGLLARIDCPKEPA
jgi:hypothetical protein